MRIPSFLPPVTSRSCAIWVLAVLTAGIWNASPAVTAGHAGERPGAAQAFGEWARGGVDPAAQQQKRRQLQAWLASELPAGALDTPLAITVTPEDMRELEKLNKADPTPFRVGLTRSVAQRIDFAGVGSGGSPHAPEPFSHGVLQATADGGYVWSMTITSQNATALRVHFTHLSLPATSELYLYNLDGEAVGPYTGSGPQGTGEFWSPTVSGSTVVIQLRHFGPASPQDLRATSFVIADVGHIGPRFQPQAGSNLCADNASCVKNAQCSAIPPAIQYAQYAVGLMQWISFPFIYTCTGGLIADSDSTTEIPYFLTANHCISRGRDARNLEVFFQYTKACDSTTACQDPPVSAPLSTLGATIRATNQTGDYTLLELNQAPPAGSSYLGWTSDPVAFSNGLGLYRISHPAWAPQAYSEHVVDTTALTCTQWPRGGRIYSRDIVGATEGGSSGSPVMNAAGQIVGQLSGACGFSPEDSCDAETNATVDGAFARYYSEVASYLDSGTSCTPVAEVCDNGSDDDCDGAVDCADSDCTGAPVCSSACPLGQPGESCTSNADCCSNNCKGPRNNKTCR